MSECLSQMRKPVGPATCLQFAGITLDTVNMHARLPEDKLARCRGLLTEFYNKRSVTLKELQSLIGLLNFACSVVLPGRAFLRRMIDLTKGVRKPYYYIRLTRQCKEDILLWPNFLNSFNGKSFFLSISAKWLTSSNIKLYTDSAGSLGYAAVLGKRWFYGHWPDSWKSLNITILELFLIVLATEIWGGWGQNMDQGSMDSHLGPGPWTTIMDRVHGPPVMDRVHMDSFFRIVRNEQKQK